MNKKDYIDAINEIEVDDKLKKEALNKVREKNSYKKIYTIATAMLVFAIAISIAVPISVNKNKVNPIQIIEENNGLPRIENFDNFYSMMQEKNFEYNSEYKNIQGEFIQEAIQTNSLEETTTDSSRDYSLTNVQVEGVDEADIVKTDGEYIYYISFNKIIIVSAKNELELISEIEYDEQKFYPSEIFISNNKLIVIGETVDELDARIYSDVAERSYPTDNIFTQTKIYNTENKENPILEREIKIEGSYLSSRMIKDNIYLISNKNIYSYLFKNTAIQEMSEEDFKPRYMDTSISTEEKSIDYYDIYYFPESDDTSYLNIAGFNIYSNEEVNIESYLGAGNEIYCSEDNLYITKVKYEYKDTKTYGYYNNYDVNTYIYKFKLENSKAEYINVGSVPGAVLNQFSMDETNGYFRIATTDSKNWNAETNSNNLYVLNENLEIVGKVEGLAKGEKIYSVRFMGNRAYMVTFVQTDPLFVIDLSEPTNPTVLGELKIPGYSKYLHPYDENHIIGFGENTEVNAYGGVVTTGMKMAVFDVSNPKEPKELYSVDIGERGTYSEILYNHKALLFSKEKNIIAFPIYISEEEGGYKTNLKFQGAIIYGLDLENGFTQRGTIAHMQIENGYIDYDYKKEVERIMYIKDSLYTLSKELIKQTNMETMQEQSILEI